MTTSDMQLSLSGGARQALALVLVSTSLVAAIPRAWAADEDPCIRRIILEKQPIFTAPDRARLSWIPLGLADALHIDTRDGVIRRELLFEEGERVSRSILDESERKLRSTGFLVDVSIETQTIAPDSVDVYVHTREVWTTTVDVQFERFEDETLLSTRVAESNFLGTGRAIAVERKDEFDRDSWTFGFEDPQFIDGRWRLGLFYRDSDDGRANSWQLSRPFFAIESDWGLESSYTHSGAAPRYYLEGTTYIRPRADFTQGRYVVARRLRSMGSGVLRGGLGVMVADQRFTPGINYQLFDARGELDAGADLGAGIPENRQVRAPVLQLQRRSMRYAQRRYLFRMGRQEDVPLGHEFILRAGWISKALGSSFAGIIFDTQESWNHVRGSRVLRFTGTAEGHLSRGRDPNVRARVQAAVYQQLPRDFTFASSVLVGTGSHVDRNDVFRLGIDSGLRSARPQEYPGDRLLRANVETRWVYRPGLWNLMTPGLAAFADFGSAWFEDETDLSVENLVGALGIGLRLGLDRAALNAPMRVDFAWPVLYSGDRDAPVVSIGVGQVF